MFEKVVLMHVASYNLDISALYFTVMPSGTLVFWGKHTTANPAFHWYACSTSELVKLRTLPPACKCAHTGTTSILGIRVASKELLAVSCSRCCLIRLVNMETAQVSTAFKLGDVHPTAMCEGEAGEMFVAGHSVILHLNCSTEELQLLQMIPVSPAEKEITAMSYIPRQRLITVGCESEDSSPSFQAISVDTKETVWKGEGGGVSSLVYSAELDVLFAVDSGTNIVLAFNAKDGAMKFRSPELPIKWLGNLCLNRNQLMLHCIGQDGTKVMCWQLCSPPSRG